MRPRPRPTQVSSRSIPGTEAPASSVQVLPGFPPAPALDAGAGELRECMSRAGALLTRRARSEHELGERLAGSGFAPEVVEAALARLRELRLVDDLDFATRWVEERSGRKALGPGALRTELAAKGVDPVTIETALEAVAGDEEARATDLAATLVRRVARKPLAAQASSLWQMLRRKGYSAEACEAAVKAVMPPEGWD